MNDLCVDVGFNSLIKKNEVLCGDNVSTITCEDGTFIAVLADGLGSGVKACILSTLTSKIISTMVSENIDISECVKTIAATLPICQVRGRRKRRRYFNTIILTSFLCAMGRMLSCPMSA